MATETERKFLLRDQRYKSLAARHYDIVQAWLFDSRDKTLRIRIRDNEAFITVKGPSSDDGVERFEWEKPIPFEEARELMQFCLKGKIEKTRYLVPAGPLTFEVDEFHGDNEGLVIAELELPSADTPYPRPDWLGEEVTGDKRYYNVMLSKHPYKMWK